MLKEQTHTHSHTYSRYEDKQWLAQAGPRGQRMKTPSPTPKTLEGAASSQVVCGSLSPVPVGGVRGGKEEKVGEAWGGGPSGKHSNFVAHLEKERRFFFFVGRNRG